MNGVDDLEGRIITSDEAKTFLQMVTKEFYSRSYLGLWMFEVIGREWDDLREWAEGLKNEINPQTCTWSIAIWEWVYGFEPDESLSLEYRRQRIMSRIRKLRPINPEAVRRGVATLIGVEYEDVTVTDFVAPYTFEVFFRTYKNEVSDRVLMEYLNEIKPSHLAIRVREETVREYRVKILFGFGGAIGTEQRLVPVGIRRTQKTEIRFSRGSYDRTHTWTQPVGEDRTMEAVLTMSNGGAFGTERKDIPLPVKKTSTEQRNGAGGLYSRTHIIGKIIKEGDENGEIL